MVENLTAKILRRMLNDLNGKTITKFLFHPNRISDLVKDCPSEIDPVTSRSEIAAGKIGTIFKEKIKLRIEPKMDVYIIFALNERGSIVTSYNLKPFEHNRGDQSEKKEEKDHTGMIQNPIDGTWKFF